MTAQTARSLGAKFSRSTRWAFLESMLTAGSSLLTALLLARFLSPVDFGLAGIAIATSAIVQAALLGGLPDALIRAPSVHSRLIDAAFCWFGLLGIAAALVPLLVALVMWSLGDTGPLPALMIVQGLTGIAVGIAAAPTGLLIRKMRTRSLVNRTASAKLVSMVVSILLAWRGAGPWAIILGNLASQFAATAQLLAASRRPHLRLHDPHIASLLRLGFLSGAQTTLGTITTRGFIIAFGAAYGAHAVGLLNFALRLVEESCGVILNTLRRVTVTSFAAARRRGLDIRPLFMRGTAMIAYVAAPLFLGLAAVAQEAVPFLFGAKWAAAVPAFQLLLILWVVRACRMLVNAIMLVEGEQRQMVMLGLFGVAATALAFTLLLPFGPDWAIYAYSGTLLGVILGGGLFRRFTGITIAQQLLAPLRPILFALIMCAVVALARQALPADWPLMMRLALLIGAGGVAFTSLAFILDRRSLQDLAKIARRQ